MLAWLVLLAIAVVVALGLLVALWVSWRRGRRAGYRGGHRTTGQISRPVACLAQLAFALRCAATYDYGKAAADLSELRSELPQTHR